VGFRELLQRLLGSKPETAPAGRNLEPDEEYWTPPEVVEIPISDTLDLHTFAPRDLGGLVPDFLEQAAEAGFFEVRIIHGKGRGVLRKSVHALLDRLEVVAEFRLVPENPGATWVRLRKT
jgi:DNA-nicking Smr family endonuclease